MRPPPSPERSTRVPTQYKEMSISPPASKPCDAAASTNVAKVPSCPARHSSPSAKTIAKSANTVSAYSSAACADVSQSTFLQRFVSHDDRAISSICTSPHVLGRQAHDTQRTGGTVLGACDIDDVDPCTRHNDAAPYISLDVHVATAHKLACALCPIRFERSCRTLRHVRLFPPDHRTRLPFCPNRFLCLQIIEKRRA